MNFDLPQKKEDLRMRQIRPLLMTLMLGIVSQLAFAYPEKHSPLHRGGLLTFEWE